MLPVRPCCSRLAGDRRGSRIARSAMPVWQCESGDVGSRSLVTPGGTAHDPLPMARATRNFGDELNSLIWPRLLPISLIRMRDAVLGIGSILDGRHDPRHQAGRGLGLWRL